MIRVPLKRAAMLQVASRLISDGGFERGRKPPPDMHAARVHAAALAVRPDGTDSIRSTPALASETCPGVQAERSLFNWNSWISHFTDI